MTFAITFNGDRMAAAIRARMTKHLSAIAVATTGAARIIAADIKREGDADIKAAGNFGPRWQRSLNVAVTPKTGALINARIDVWHDIKYAGEFETGAVHTGHPLMWIPLSYTGIKMRAKEYAKRYGGLFFVQPKGAGRVPLLFSKRDRKPKYFGISTTHLRQRFHLRAICLRAAKRYPTVYRELRKAA